MATLSNAQKLRFAQLLSDQEWRLDNLYWVVDEHGQEVQFKLNPTQRFLYKNLWFLSVILKSRQHGVTTLILLLWLDFCLFSENIQCGIVAHNREDAEYIFENKAKFAFKNLSRHDPLMRDFLLSYLSVSTDTANEMRFSTGSVLRVATSLRSGTFQFVLISELGKICAKYPDKADEIVSGTFNAVHAGNHIVVESTAEGRTGHFFRICSLARDLAYSKKKLSSLDWRFFFFGWHDDPRNQLDMEQTETTEWREYFDMVESQIARKLNRRQKNWYIAKSRTMGDKMKQEHPSTPEEAFEKNLVGSYYGSQMIQVRKEKRIGRVPYEPSLPVVTSWDLGISSENTTNIIFTQVHFNEKRIIDYYENHSEGFQHYVRVLREKGYVYTCHFLPHDVNVKEMGTGKLRINVLQSLMPGERIIPVPRLSVEDGIEAVRNLLASCWFDEEKCGKLITALDEYRREWDDKNGVFRVKPLHNMASNAADAMRMLAVVMGTYYTPENVRQGKHLTFRDDEDDYEMDHRHADSVNRVTGY